MLAYAHYDDLLPQHVGLHSRPLNCTPLSRHPSFHQQGFTRWSVPGWGSERYNRANELGSCVCGACFRRQVLVENGGRLCRPLLWRGPCREKWGCTGKRITLAMCHWGTAFLDSTSTVSSKFAMVLLSLLSGQSSSLSWWQTTSWILRGFSSCHLRWCATRLQAGFGKWDCLLGSWN